MKEELQEWCRRYREEEFGGLRTYHYNNRFLETGMRRMALRVQLNNGENRYFGHRGLALGENREYVFVFDEPLTIDRIALVLGIVPGVLVDIKSVTFRTRSEAETFDTDEFLIFPQSGYSVEGGNLSTSRDGETLEFEFPEEAFNEVHSISVEVATDRARIASATVCGGAQTR